MREWGWERAVLQVTCKASLAARHRRTLPVECTPLRALTGFTFPNCEVRRVLTTTSNVEIVTQGQGGPAVVQSNTSLGSFVELFESARRREWTKLTCQMEFGQNAGAADVWKIKRPNAFPLDNRGPCFGAHELGSALPPPPQPRLGSHSPSARVQDRRRPPGRWYRERTVPGTPMAKCMDYGCVVLGDPGWRS